MMNRQAASVAAFMIAALVTTAPDSTASNGDARIVLHAQPYAPQNACTTPQDSLGLDCENVRPIVSVQVAAELDVYVYLQNYDAVAAAQMAFEWDQSWSFLYWIGACQSNEVLGTNAPQVSGDSYVGAFDMITGGALAPIGRMRFTAGTSGTDLSISDSPFPFGTHVIDGSGIVAPIPESNRGLIAVEAPGVDSCGGDSKSNAFY